MTLPILPPLYVVTDRHQVAEEKFLDILSQIMSHSRVMLQLREKDLPTRRLLPLAQAVQSLASLHRVPLLINDRLDLAMVVEAAGVHLRSNSLPVQQVRKCLGSEKVIGVSVHSVEEARRCEDAGADFVVLGPIYETPSKRSYGAPLGLQAVKDASEACHIPVYAIGGITLVRLDAVKQSGAYGVAVISAILCADNPQEAVKHFTTHLGVPK